MLQQTDKHVTINSMEVVIGLGRHDSSWDRYLMRVKYVARLLACVTISEDLLNPPDEVAVIALQHIWLW